MGINVKGENCKLWKNEHKDKDGNVFFTYSVGVSKKDLKGNWVRSYQEVQFTKDADPAGIPNGTIFDFEGWLSPRPYKGRDGKLVNKTIIMINKANFQYDEEAGFEAQADSFEQLEEDVPFN